MKHYQPILLNKTITQLGDGSECLFEPGAELLFISQQGENIIAATPDGRETFVLAPGEWTEPDAEAAADDDARALSELMEQPHLLIKPGDEIRVRFGEQIITGTVKSFENGELVFEDAALPSVLPEPVVP